MAFGSLSILPNDIFIYLCQNQRIAFCELVKTCRRGQELLSYAKEVYDFEGRPLVDWVKDIKKYMYYDFIHNQVKYSAIEQMLVYEVDDILPALYNTISGPYGFDIKIGRLLIEYMNGDIYNYISERTGYENFKDCKTPTDISTKLPYWRILHKVYYRLMYYIRMLIICSDGFAVHLLLCILDVIRKEKNNIGRIEVFGMRKYILGMRELRKIHRDDTEYKHIYKDILEELLRI